MLLRPYLNMLSQHLARTMVLSGRILSGQCYVKFTFIWWCLACHRQSVVCSLFILEVAELAIIFIKGVSWWRVSIFQVLFWLLLFVLLKEEQHGLGQGAKQAVLVLSSQRPAISRKEVNKSLSP